MHTLIPLNGRLLILLNDWWPDRIFRYIGTWHETEDFMSFGVTPLELETLAAIGKLRGKVNGRSWIVVSLKWRNMSWILLPDRHDFKMIGRWNYSTKKFTPVDGLRLTPIELESLSDKLKDK